MKIRFNIWVIFIAAMIGLIGLVHAQSAGQGRGKTIPLENGEEVADLNGEWDALIENYGVQFGTQRGVFKNIIKITQEGSLFKAIRLQDDAGASAKRKGSIFMQGELEKSGMKTVYYIDRSARLLPCTGQISEGGNKIMIDEGFLVRATLTRK